MDTSNQFTDSTTQPLQPSSLAQSLATILTTAPELGQSPGLAVGVASSGGDPTVRAQSIALQHGPQRADGA